VGILGAFAVYSKLRADQARAGAHFGHVSSYVMTMAIEWLLFAFVLWGAPSGTVLAARWSSALEILRDFAIAILFWISSLVVLGLIARVVQAPSIATNVKFMLPHGWVESILWVALSATAGICEEAIFRGYLQPQFASLTRDARVGILLSSAVFGAVHAYQGWRSAAVIFVYGAMFGALAEWRKSVRPGMIAHAWGDAVAGLAAARLT
jgi:uncharacterized protein